MKNLTTNLLILLFISLGLTSYTTYKPSFLGKEITIEFSPTKENLFLNTNELAFKLLANLTKQELNDWEKSVISDPNVAQLHVKKNKSTSSWSVKITLKNTLNATNAKMLFSYALKTDFVIFNGEKMLFNVFISKYIPN